MHAGVGLARGAVHASPKHLPSDVGLMVAAEAPFCPLAVAGKGGGW